MKHPHSRWVEDIYHRWSEVREYRIKGGKTPIIARNSGLTSGTLVATTTTIHKMLERSNMLKGITS